MKVIELSNFLKPLKSSEVDLVREMEKYGIVGQSESIIESFLKLKKASKSEANILIEGESGT